jgi:GNAT superfamily N-acetyltransferase
MAEQPSISYQKLSRMDRISDLRNIYLDLLPHSQEYYIELEIKKSQPYLVLVNNIPAGYFFLSAKQAVLEYFIRPDYIHLNDGILGDIIHKFEVKTAWCKTYDHDMLACCYTYQKFSRVMAILFRDYVEKPLPPMPENLTVRLAGPEDESTIQGVNEEVFDSPEEVTEYINSGQIFLFELGSDLVGFGIYSCCIPGRMDYDIGMLVVEKYRRQGYACQILRYLINFCLGNGWRVGAGCYILNTPSRRSLEKVGFIARYRLLEFIF